MTVISFIVQAPGPNVIKVFTAVIFVFSAYDIVFVSVRPVQPSLMFVGKTWILRK